MAERITLETIEKIDKNMLTAKDICRYLETDPSTIRVQARTRPEMLGFPVIVEKSRVKIPKDAFISYCRYGRTALPKIKEEENK